MKKRVSRRKRKSKNQSKFSETSVRVLLETGTLESIQNAKRATDEHLKYQWDYYPELARQRSINSEKISQVLTQACSSYSIKKWQRAVKYKYGLHPLSTVGSLTYIGGRFNTGIAVNQQVPHFSALYIANTKDTALQEHLGQEPVTNSKLTAREIALTNPKSETIVSVSGELEKIFDLTNADNLKPLVALIRNF